MTEADIIGFASADALVIGRNTRMVQGVPVPPTNQELQARVRTGMIATMQELLLDQSIQRSLLEDEFTLTLTGATEYELPGYVGRLLGVRRGSDSENVRLFESASDFHDWYARTYGSSTVSASNEPSAVYCSGRGGGGALKVTISPGAGSQTTLTLIYLRDPGSAPALTHFRPSTHVVILIGCLNFASGGAYAQQYEDLKQSLSRSVDPIAGGERSVPHSRRTRGMLRRLNGLISESSVSSVWPSSYAKDVT